MIPQTVVVAGQFRFILKLGNAETILLGEICKARNSADNGIATVQANCCNDDRHERKTAANGKASINLEASTGQAIGINQMYATEVSRDAGIASAKENGSSSKIKDKT